MIRSAGARTAATLAGSRANAVNHCRKGKPGDLGKRIPRAASTAAWPRNRRAAASRPVPALLLGIVPDPRQT